MKKILVLVLAACLMAAAGCSDDAKKTPASGKATAGQELVSGYALLYDLLDSEKGVDGILIIKSVSPATEKLIKEVAKVSTGGVAKLDAFKEMKPTLSYEKEDLPEVEQSARSSIAFKTAVDLLFSFGTTEVRLIITQIQATRYGANLAKTLAKHDPNEKRAKWLGEFADAYSDLYDKLIDRLAVKKN